MKARVIAMYLPQFHPIPENDKYWGAGFTEWNNVVKARPLFPGHYQPKLPADLGFYDLRLPEVRKAQADMARQAGVEGFMYWHYWFGNGKKVLERPFEEVLACGEPDFPFCLGWANHSWTNKTWTKGKAYRKDAMIFCQEYPGTDDHIAHFNYCLPAFRDKRYITVDGKPLFYVWVPDDFPDVPEFIGLWQKLAHEAGLKGIHFVATRHARSPHKIDDLLAMGYDSINNCNYNMWLAECKTRRSTAVKRAMSLLSEKLNLPLQCFSYKSIIKWLTTDDDCRDNVYPTILPGYDRSPRSGKKAQIYHNNTPRLFGRHVSDVLEHIKNKPDEHKIVFLKSWNEWGEGNYIEPDQKYGDAFLRELERQLK
ncbi:glycoside hydrolase family 99-like domain-containing protein [uncultured Muribaculum sp.]|uniref:glycosyltransferase WbsX family protein n=1 Tax=uncultured Muribaculum sp. TaxID=1918613 RepID=UPI0025B193AF|nr:glycoside hydrolase family 99-like domain-containing protein [uncultured Muribaculum sp.]